MTFSDQSAISAHYDTAHAQSSSRRPEHPDAKHECEVCGRKFTRKKSLKLHLFSVHRVGEVKKFECELCSKVFMQKCHLKTHITTVYVRLVLISKSTFHFKNVAEISREIVKK